MEINGQNWTELSDDNPWKEAKFEKRIEELENGTILTSIEGFIDTFRAEHDNTNITCSSDNYSGQIEMYIRLSKSNETGNRTQFRSGY